MLQFGIIFLAFSIIQINSISIPIISDIQDIVTLGNDITGLISGNIPFASLAGGPDPITQALAKLDDISKQIDEMGSAILDRMDKMLETLLQRLPDEIQLNEAMSDFAEQISRIDSLYDDFQSYIDTRNRYNKITIKSFVKSVTSNDGDDLPDALNKMHRLFVPGRAAAVRESLMKLMAKQRNATEAQKFCNSVFTFQERLYEIFNIIVVSELRGYVMTIFSYETLAADHNESFTREVQKATAKFVLRVEEYILTTQKKMAAAQRDLYRCDPPKHIREGTYIEMEGTIQGYLINEEQAFAEDTCYYSCGQVDSRKEYRCYKWRDGYERSGEYCQRRPCEGRMSHCASAEWAWSCEYIQHPYKRYRWVDFNDGTYGKKALGCEENDEVKGKEMIGQSAGFNNCDVCYCRCTEYFAKSEANRTFSLRPQISNIAENMVVSNIKFTTKDKLLHIQIEEAPLMTGGKINPNETNWVPLEDFKYVKDEPYGAFVKIENGKEQKLEKGVDYSFMTDGDTYFNLDEINVPKGYIMTGAKMSRHKPDDEYSPIEIAVYATPFNFNEGKLTESEENPSIWITPANQPHPHPRYTHDRYEVDYGDRVTPLATPQHLIYSETNTKIYFSVSNRYHDASQSTVPMFDAQPVSIQRMVGLNGFGVFSRNHQDYAGFLTLKLITLDISQYMNPVIQKKQLKKYKKLYRQVMAYEPPTV